MEKMFNVVEFWIHRQNTALDQNDTFIARLCQDRIDAWLVKGIEQMF